MKEKKMTESEFLQEVFRDLSEIFSSFKEIRCDVNDYDRVHALNKKAAEVLSKVDLRLRAEQPEKSIK